MVHAVDVKRMCAMLLAGAAVVTGGSAMAQSTKVRVEDPRRGDVLVNGKRMPAAEAPRSSTCGVYARDTWSRALQNVALNMGDGGQPLLPYLQPTRMPRNPDYSAPPKVAPGSPLPTVGRTRFAAPGGVEEPSQFRADIEYQTFSADQPWNDLTDPGGGPGLSSFDAAQLSCRAAYMRGYDLYSARPTIGVIGTTPGGGLLYGFDPAARAAASQRRFALARAFIASRDESLPIAFGLFDQGRYAESVDWFVKASNKLPYEAGGDEAALFAGKLYLEGLGDKSDPQEALKWLKKAATAPFNPTQQTPLFNPDQPERNTAIGEAAVILGNLYAGGFKGVERDPAQAYRWYERAYAVGHIPAAKTLGDLNRIGFGTARDAKRAAAWYKKAAEFGVPAAQVAIAEMLDRGADGVRQDRRQALRWYQAAAQRNHPDALFALAQAYDFGEGVKADPTMALGLYKTAALYGSTPAKTALGTYFHEGRVVSRSETTARSWFERAAAERDAEGMFNLAAMMANGQGGERDVTSAYMWLKQASARGHDKAPVALAALERRMTPAERQAAQAATVK